MPTLTLLRSPASVDLARGRGDVEQLAPADLDVLAQAVELVGPVAEHRVEHLLAHRDQVGVGDPGAVEAVAGLAGLVVADLGQRACG